MVPESNGLDSQANKAIACPDCGVTGAGVYCGNCGANLNQVREAPPDKICRSCGKNGTGRYCEACGAELAQTDITEKPPGCPECGVEIVGNFCQQCGFDKSRLPHGADQTDSNNAPHNSVWGELVTDLVPRKLIAVFLDFFKSEQRFASEALNRKSEAYAKPTAFLLSNLGLYFALQYWSMEIWLGSLDLDYVPVELSVTEMLADSTWFTQVFLIPMYALMGHIAHPFLDSHSRTVDDTNRIWLYLVGIYSALTGIATVVTAFSIHVGLPLGVLLTVYLVRRVYLVFRVSHGATPWMLVKAFLIATMAVTVALFVIYSLIS